MSATPIPRQVEWYEKLRVPFPASQVGKLPVNVAKDGPKRECPECGGWHRHAGTHLDFVGHAAVRGRFLDVDPEWNWEPFALDERGLPAFDLDEDGKRVGLWIWLTIHGVRRIGYGSVLADQSDAVKVLIGDALRNGGMSFGVALELWMKGSPDASQDAIPDRPVYMSAINTAAFLAKCAEAGATSVDIDAIVLKATTGRTFDPNLVLADEVTVLRAAFESWQAEHQKVAPPANKPNWQPVPTTPVGETPEALKGHSGSGKRVAKGVGPSTEGVTDLKVPSEVV